MQLAFYLTLLFITLYSGCRLSSASANSHDQAALHLSELDDSVLAAYAVDLDQDGDLDVISSLYADDHIAWYENDGAQNFTKKSVGNPNESYGVYFLSSADLDNDQDLDVLAVSSTNYRILWFENDGNQQFTHHIVHDNTEAVSWISAADIDLDGDLDLFSTSMNDKNIGWYENDGQGNFLLHSFNATNQQTVLVHSR